MATLIFARCADDHFSSHERPDMGRDPHSDVGRFCPCQDLKIRNPAPSLHRRQTMTQAYFHCSYPREVMPDRRGTAVDDLADARDQAACVVHSLTMTHSAEDWRSWILHVNDDL